MTESSFESCIETAETRICTPSGIIPRRVSTETHMSIGNFRDLKSTLARLPSKLYASTDCNSNSDSDDKSDYPEGQSLYQRLSSIFTYFNKCIQSYSEEEAPRSARELAYALRQRFYETVGNMMSTRRLKVRGLVAMMPSFSFSSDFNTNFLMDVDDYTDFFALFIDERRNVELLELSNDPIQCEIRSKKSQELISESGPYHCVFEERVDSESHNGALSKVFKDTSGRVRIFQLLKKFTQSHTGKRRDRDAASTRSSKNTRRSPTEGKRSRRSSLDVANPEMKHAVFNKAMARSLLKNYLHCFFKEEPETIEETGADENAKCRLEQHIRLHTDHWGEVQYDDIEIVLRNIQQDSFIKLPYNCQVM